MWFYSAEKWYSTENFDTRYLRFYSAEKWYLSKKITSCFFDFARQKIDIYQKKKYKWFCNFNRRKSDIYQKITGGFRNFLSIKLIFISKKLLVFFLCGGWGGWQVDTIFGFYSSKSYKTINLFPSKLTSLGEIIEKQNYDR